MSYSLFHHAGRDRVESATLAVLARADLSVVRALLADAGGLGDDLAGVVVAPPTSHTAARLTARVDWSFEIIARGGAFDDDGPARHRVRRLAEGLDAEGWLFVLSADPPVPEWLTDPDGVSPGTRRRIVWISFAWLAAAVRDALGDPERVVDAGSRLLLTELVGLYDAEGLLHAADPVEAAPADDTLVVVEPDAWRDYLDHAVHVVRRGASLPPGVDHVAFHRDGRVMALVPRILECLPEVELTERSATALRDAGRPDAADAVAVLAADDRYAGGRRRAVLLLAPAADPACVRLPAPVPDPGTTSHRLTRLDLLTRS